MQIYDMHISAETTAAVGGGLASAANGTVRAGVSATSTVQSGEGSGDATPFVAHLDVATAPGSQTGSQSATDGANSTNGVSSSLGGSVSGAFLDAMQTGVSGGEGTAEAGVSTSALAETAGAAVDPSLLAAGSGNSASDVDLAAALADELVVGDGTIKIAPLDATDADPVMFPATIPPVVASEDEVDAVDLASDEAAPVLPVVVIPQPITTDVDAPIATLADGDEVIGGLASLGDQDNDAPGFFPGKAPAGAAGDNLAGQPVGDDAATAAPAVGPATDTESSLTADAGATPVSASGDGATDAPQQPIVSTGSQASSNPSTTVADVPVQSGVQVAAMETSSDVADTPVRPIATPAAETVTTSINPTLASAAPASMTEIQPAVDPAIQQVVVDAASADDVDVPEETLSREARPVAQTAATVAPPSPEATQNAAGQARVVSSLSNAAFDDGTAVVDDGSLDAADDGLPRQNRDAATGSQAATGAEKPAAATKTTAAATTAAATLAGAPQLQGAMRAGEGDALEFVLGGTSRSGEGLVQPSSSSSSSSQTLPMAMMAMEITRNAQRGVSRFAIRLDPPELGRVDVRLKIGDDGQVRAHLIVERPETLDMLLRDQRSMERALENAGLKTAAEGALEFSLKDQSGQSFADSGDGAGDTAGHGSGDTNAGEQPVDQQTALERVAAYARNAAGGLDIRV